MAGRDGGRRRFKGVRNPRRRNRMTGMVIPGRGTLLLPPDEKMLFPPREEREPRLNRLPSIPLMALWIDVLDLPLGPLFDGPPFTAPPPPLVVVLLLLLLIVLPSLPSTFDPFPPPLFG